MQTRQPAVSRDQVGTWINLLQTVRVIHACIEEKLKGEADLAWPEFELLMRLNIAADRPLQMGEIASQLVGSASGTTRIADRLERDGLIVRETPRENRRVVQVQLTDRGREVLATADALFRDTLQAKFGDHLRDHDVVELRLVLRHLLEANGAWQESRCDLTPTARPMTRP